MKLPFTIYDLRFTISNKSDRAVDPLAGESGAQGVTRPAGLASDRKSPIVNRKSPGIALIITLILLSVTLVMALAFLALARRERGSVTTSTDTTTARLAAETAVANAEAQIVANILNNSANAYNLHLLVSTNYINARGFTPGSGNPTNVNYDFQNQAGLPPLTVDMWDQNISNLYFLPRAPVFVPTNLAASGYEFRFYLDLNQNGQFDTNGVVANLVPDSSGQAVPNGTTSFQVGDPEWVGVLEHPDATHGPDNHFVSRYAFIAQPVGNTLDVNYIHNEAYNVAHNPQYPAHDSGI